MAFSTADESRRMNRGAAGQLEPKPLFLTSDDKSFKVRARYYRGESLRKFTSPQLKAPRFSLPGKFRQDVQTSLQLMAEIVEHAPLRQKAAARNYFQKCAVRLQGHVRNNIRQPRHRHMRPLLIKKYEF